jgi:two-component system sensor histidine kinase DegS
MTQWQEQVKAEQREWISHEIHDGACQYVTASQMMFDTFRRAQTPGKDCDWNAFERAMEFLDRADDELRRLARGLRPIQLTAGNLQKAVECLVMEIREAGGPDVELCCALTHDLLPEFLELAVFRIVQETVSNACRHSKSKHILVGLSQTDDSFSIHVRDWGTGFDSNAIPYGCFGIKGIQQRVVLFHGNMTIQSELGEGTLISVSIPLER